MSHRYCSLVIDQAIECCIIIDLCVVQCVAEVVPSFLPLAAQFGLSKNSHMTFIINPSSLRKRWVSHVGKAAFRCDVLLNVPLTLGFAWTSTPSPQTNNATSSSPQCVVEVIGSKPNSRRTDPPPVRCQTDGLCCPQTDGGKGDVVSRPRERSHLHHFTCRHQRWTMAQCKSVICVMSHNRVTYWHLVELYLDCVSGECWGQPPLSLIGCRQFKARLSVNQRKPAGRWEATVPRRTATRAHNQEN